MDSLFDNTKYKRKNMSVKSSHATIISQDILHAILCLNTLFHALHFFFSIIFFSQVKRSDYLAPLFFVLKRYLTENKISWFLSGFEHGMKYEINSSKLDIYRILLVIEMIKKSKNIP